MVRDRWDAAEARVHVTLEEGDYTTPDGFRHVGGVSKVKATLADGKPYKGRVYKGRARTFKGETAWMDAQRLYEDIIAEVRFGR